MRIKRLEIKGFKSFPDKTVLELKPGITAVVGPNGCGKSNIFESIRWVMGEQRVRSLRSSKMEDVIFSGSATRKPVGLAEVRLVLTRSGGIWPPSMEDYEEIMVARRLFRDGQSHYEINNIPCRLSDVVEFFLDTGVGKNSYAIIEQGRVDMVVASKPGDRRVLIEEAAGISKYKVRREAALKRLEQTRLDLTRISDMTAEAERRCASLRKQAEQAELFRELSNRLREGDMALHAGKCARLQDRLSELNDDLNGRRAAAAEHEAQLACIGAKLEESRLPALNAERALTGLIEERHKAELELTAVRGTIEKESSELAGIRGNCARLAGETVAGEEAVEQIRTSISDLGEQRSAVAAELDAAGADLYEGRSDAESRDRLLAELRNKVDRSKDELFRTLQEASELRNRLAGHSKRLSEIETEFDRMNLETRELREQKELLLKRRRELSAETEATEALRESETDRRGDLIIERSRLRKAVGEARAGLTEKEKELAAVGATHGSLEEMHRTYGSYEDGVRFLMQDEELKPSLIGPLAELLDVDPEFQKPLLSILGDRLGHLVVASTSDGVEAVRRLDAASAGRSVFIPLNPRCSDEGNLMEEPPEGVIRLMEAVRYPDRCRRLAEFLLGRSFVVDNIRQAVEIWETGGIQADFVTWRGETLNRYGE
ncbi:MAG: AAA family ATPase, partial [Pseudomonadota bacterium]